MNKLGETVVVEAWEARNLWVEGTDLGGMGRQEEKSPFSIEDYERQLALWSTPECKAGYQDLLDEINGKKSSGAPDSLPTAKELSERFGGSFAPILERFKEQIRFEIEDGTMALKVPLYLDALVEQLGVIFKTSSQYANTKITDNEKNITKKVFLEICRVDISIRSPEPSDLGDLTAGHEDKVEVVPEGSCRDLDEDGIVANPGIGDEWILLKLYDAKHDRNLEVRFKVYFQVPKGNNNDIDKHLLRP